MATNFNKKEIYKTEIEQKILELKQICNREKIPMFISVCVANSDKKTEYENDMISPGTHGIVLTDNKIPLFVNITRGFKTVLPDDIPEINFD